MSTKIQIKPPLTYYGGKQKMLSHILPLVPHHTLYTEAFAGGAAVFFAKHPSPVEVINDTNGEVVNFYRMVQTNFDALQKEILCCLHSRDLLRQAKVVYENPDLFSEVKRAWAFWTLANQSFGSSLNGTWSYDNSSGKMPHKLQNKRQCFVEEYAQRLQNVQIDCTDALRLIASRDRTDAFFYLDPPYFQANMGHYGGYTAQQFEDLLRILSTLKGKFLLSSYPSELLSGYVNENHWHSIELAGKISIFSSKGSYCKPKTEVLTANYPISLLC